MNIHVKAQARN